MKSIQKAITLPVTAADSKAPIRSAALALVQGPTAGFLNNREELVMVALPWIGVVATIGFWLFNRFGVDFEVDDVTVLLTTLIFLDSVHIIWTYVLLLASPELKQWAKAENTKVNRGWLKGRGPWGQSLMVALALGGVYWFVKGSISMSGLRGMATTWLLLDLIGPAQHTVAQMRGISLCYNSNLRKTFEFGEVERAQALRCEKLERLFFKILLFGEILYWIPEIFEIDKFEIPGIDMLQDIGGMMIIGSAVALLVNALYFPRHEESRKFAFLFRVMLFPMKMLNVIGGIGVRAAHGTEYLFVFRRMMEGSNIPKPKRTKVYLITVGVSLLYLIPFLLTWTTAFRDLTGLDVPDLVLTWALGLVFVLRFTHYYMDSVLFRMSNPATREIVGPLLTKAVPVSR